jgi:hypothetical protein
MGSERVSIARVDGNTARVAGAKHEAVRVIKAKLRGEAVSEVGLNEFQSLVRLRDLCDLCGEKLISETVRDGEDTIAST